LIHQQLKEERQMNSKWYVFDEFDCIDEYNSQQDAIDSARKLGEMGFEKIEIRHMSLAEFNQYCMTGVR
jgi:hypothetical protein